MVWTLIYHGKLANQIAKLAAIVVKNDRVILKETFLVCIFFLSIIEGVDWYNFNCENALYPNRC